MSKAPPVPPANRSRKAPHRGQTAAGTKRGDVQGQPDPEYKGQQATNTRQTTTQHGYQQDR